MLQHQVDKCKTVAPSCLYSIYSFSWFYSEFGWACTASCKLRFDALLTDRQTDRQTESVAQRCRRLMSQWCTNAEVCVSNSQWIEYIRVNHIVIYVHLCHPLSDLFHGGFLAESSQVWANVTVRFGGDLRMRDNNILTYIQRTRLPTLGLPAAKTLRKLIV